MDNFNFDAFKSQEENLEAFFNFCIQKDPVFGNIIADNKDLLTRVDGDASSLKTEFRTKVAQQVSAVYKQSE